MPYCICVWLLWWQSGKEPACQCRRYKGCGFDPPGGGNGYPLQYSSLENPMDRGAWWAIVHGVAESGMIEPIWYMYYTCIHIMYIHIYVCVCLCIG